MGRRPAKAGVAEGEAGTGGEGGRGAVRIQVVLNPRSAERLERLRDRTEAASAAEVVRHSLWVYETVLDETEGDGRLAVRRKDGQIALIRLPV